MADQFRQFDKNGNGRLSREELIEGFREIRGIDFSEKEIDDLIKRVDIDGSGDIDYNEFVNGAISTEKMLSEERLEKAFKLFDANGDNSISMQEIRAVLDQCKEVDESLVEKAIKDIGKTSAKTASLSFQEFKLFIKKLFV